MHQFHVRAHGRVVGEHRVVALPRGSRLRLDSLVERAGAEAARFLGVLPREIETVRARSRRKGSGAASAHLGIF